MANINSETVELVDNGFNGNESNTMDLLPLMDLSDLLDYNTNGLSSVISTNHLVASSTCDLRIGDVVETEIQCWECGQWVIHYKYCSKCGSKIVNMEDRCKSIAKAA